jgi:hypothetical protein
MSESTPPFQYSPLDTNVPGYFRLVELHAGQLGSDVKCSLIHGSWVDATYEALSYVWGESIFSKDIQLSGHSFNVTENLHSALNYLRYSDRSRVLWIDAICTNQTEIPERNQQVQHMGEIYRHAKRVVVWLCESTQATEQGLNFLVEVKDYLASKGFTFASIPEIYLMKEDTWKLSVTFSPRNTPRAGKQFVHCSNCHGGYGRGQFKNLRLDETFFSLSARKKPAGYSSILLSVFSCSSLCQSGEELG